LIASQKVRCREGVVVVGKCLNSSVTVIEFGEGVEGTVVKYGDVGHLSGTQLVQTNVDET